jgi:hypothetical membrane protein
VTVRETPRLGRFFSFTATLALIGSALDLAIVALVLVVYRGAQGEPYSLANHFISELGQPGISRLAWLFNAGLVVSGALFVPWCIALGLRLRTVWAYLGMASGIAAGVFLAGVGMFPMSNLEPHIFVAMWFFRCGLATTLLFGIAMVAQPRGSARHAQGARPRNNPRVPSGARVPRSACIFSLIAVAAYAGFLGLATVMGTDAMEAPTAATLAHRPGFWLLAVMEWSVFFATIIWFLGVALLVKVGGRAAR